MRGHEVKALVAARKGIRADAIAINKLHFQISERRAVCRHCVQLAKIIHGSPERFQQRPRLREKRFSQPAIRGSFEDQRNQMRSRGDQPNHRAEGKNSMRVRMQSESQRTWCDPPLQQQPLSLRKRCRMHVDSHRRTAFHYCSQNANPALIAQRKRQRDRVEREDATYFNREGEMRIAPFSARGRDASKAAIAEGLSKRNAFS